MPKEQNHYVDENGAIVTLAGGLIYASADLEGMSRQARERLAELHTKNPEWDWMKASAVLVEVGLIEPF